MKVFGNIVDVNHKSIIRGFVNIENGFIVEICEQDNPCDNFIIPGFIDSHVHIESSMVTPGFFATTAVSRGTIGVVNDPHEIANVMGYDGIRYMVDDAAKVPFKFWFCAPSCVPATCFETTGGVIGVDDIERLLSRNDFVALSEMMNYPGVIYNDHDVMAKLKIAQKLGKPIDGHAPGLTGDNLKKYVSAGISTDHECTTIEEAREKIALGMKVIMREGSAARNINSLKPLLKSNPDDVMICTDDIHPDKLKSSYLDVIIAKLVNEGYDLFDVLRACTLNPSKHYKLNAGSLLPGQPADFVVIDNIKSFNVIETWIDGRKVYDKGKVLFQYDGSEAINRFNCREISKEDISVTSTGKSMKVIKSTDGSLITERGSVNVSEGKKILSEPGSDLLKIVVKDRYHDGRPAVAFINGFELTRGAIACSVAHDSHNIVCVGCSDDDIVAAINEIIRLKGGMVVVNGDNIFSIPLPIGGLMSPRSVEEMGDDFEKINSIVKSLGCNQEAPFMTLSFMALLVIPELKLSDKGLFDVSSFNFTELFAD